MAVPCPPPLQRSPALPAVPFPEMEVVELPVVWRAAVAARDFEIGEEPGPPLARPGRLGGGTNGTLRIVNSSTWEMLSGEFTILSRNEWQHFF